MLAGMLAPLGHDRVTLAALARAGCARRSSPRRRLRGARDNLAAAGEEGAWGDRGQGSGSDSVSVSVSGSGSDSVSGSDSDSDSVSVSGSDSVSDSDFRRQHIVGGFIVDFACVTRRLVVEVDGAAHAGEDAAVADARRQRELELAGWRVIRFSHAATCGRSLVGNFDWRAASPGRIVGSWGVVDGWRGASSSR